jgi:glycosyltransferase involved in cell wall biosynthesis
MNNPLVSICLPNLNTFPYLAERLDTILTQTYTNWELIVVDSYSEDGAWELFQRVAEKDRRVSITQAPRGLYEGWNNCIGRARGQYIYIATSDDTMAPDCLEKLVAALENRPDCELASCNLLAIDGSGAPLKDPSWRDAMILPRAFPGLLKQRHTRRAPFDGLLHLTGYMVHLSITQLLIRRSLFSRIGGFETRWGPLGDRNWEMKAGLVANTVHVPDTWATWRLHIASASSSQSYHSPDYTRKIEEMVDDAVRKCWQYLAPAIVAGLDDHWLSWTRDMRLYYSGLRRRRRFQRRLFQAGQFFSGSTSVRRELIDRLMGLPEWPRTAVEIRGWLETLGLDPITQAPIVNSGLVLVEPGERP